MSPWAPLGQFLRFSCFDDWQFWVLPVSYFVECSSAGIHRKLFSWIGCGYSFLAEGLRKKCVIFIISKVYSTNRIYHYWGWPPSPVWCGICSFLHNKVPPLYPSHLSSTCSPHLGVGRYSPPPLLQSIYINYLKFPALKICLISQICALFNQLFVSVWTSGYLFYTILLSTNSLQKLVKITM